MPVTWDQSTRECVILRGGLHKRATSELRYRYLRVHMEYMLIAYAHHLQQSILLISRLKVDPSIAVHLQAAFQSALSSDDEADMSQWLCSHRLASCALQASVNHNSAFTSGPSAIGML